MTVGKDGEKRQTEDCKVGGKGQRKTRQDSYGDRRKKSLKEKASIGQQTVPRSAL